MTHNPLYKCLNTNKACGIVTCGKVRQSGEGYERQDGLGGVLVVVQRICVHLQPRYLEKPLQTPLRDVIPLFMLPMVGPF
jgi:hypothetical protein